MPEITPQELNKLFILLNRSLLQYVGESWPWTAESGRDVQTLATFRQLVSRQQRDRVALGEPLTEAGWPIDFGTYVTDFTDLQYLSLNYLLKQVVKSQTKIQAALDAAATAYPDSPLLQQIADSERELLKSVQALVAPAAVATQAS